MSSAETSAIKDRSACDKGDLEWLIKEERGGVDGWVVNEDKVKGQLGQY